MNYDNYKPQAIIDPVSMEPLKRQRLYLQKRQGTLKYLLEGPDGDFNSFVQMITLEQLCVCMAEQVNGGVKRTRTDE